MGHITPFFGFDKLVAKRKGLCQDRIHKMFIIPSVKPFIIEF